MQGSWRAVSWGVSLWLPSCSGLFCVGIFHTQLRAELLAPVASSKSGYGVSQCAVLSVLSVQSPACFSLPRVNKPLDNVWILQKGTWDGSRGKVMGWDQGAVRRAGLCALHQTQLGHGWLKCRNIGNAKAPVWGRGQRPVERKQGQPPAPAGCR